MRNKISVKYALIIVCVITTITLIFVPIYIYAQKNQYINSEKSAMAQYITDLKENAPFTNPGNLATYIEETNEKGYKILISDGDKNIIFPTNNHPKNIESSLKQPESNFDKYTRELTVEYKNKDDLNRESISIYNVFENKDGTFYIYARESLRNLGSVFDYTNRMLIFILILYILVCAVSIIILMSGITKSIRRLTEVVRKIAQKDYSVRYEYKISSDEVGTLANNFNNMADTIQDNMTAIKNYNFLLKEDNEHLREYESMRQRFVRNTTHELKTPLAIISSQIEMMNCTENAEKKEYYYNSAMQEIQKMSALITSFLRKNPSGIINRDAAKEINLSKKIDSLCNSCAGHISVKKIVFTRNIDSDCIVYASETHIEHIFNNYVTNAIKHTESKGRITVSLKKSEDKIRLSVYNDGNTIDSETAEKIWDEFFTSSQEDLIESSGLGLFIVKEISLINGTDCGVENRENGVEFWYDFNLQ